jgi:AraC-like DNA-binding protein
MSDRLHFTTLHGPGAGPIPPAAQPPRPPCAEAPGTSLPTSLPPGWGQATATSVPIRSQPSCYEADTAFIPVGQWPSLIRSHAQRRDIQLRPSATEGRCSPRDMLALLAELARQDSPDSAFALGQHWLPGHDGALSHALLQARDAADALSLLVRWQARLSPLLSPRLVLGPQQAVLYWVDACGAPAQRNYLVDLHMSAVVSLCRWLAGEPWPWAFCFNRPPPRETALQEVHLGPTLHWNCQLDAMTLDHAWLHRPWQRGQGPAAEAARQAWSQSTAQREPQRSVLTALYDHLRDHIRTVPTLESTAQAFGCSPATFKRLLARHGTHFQAELDQVRAHVALHLFHHQGWSNDAVAIFLGFHDAANFRRSFRRWTGFTPKLLRDHLLTVAGRASGALEP